MSELANIAIEKELRDKLKIIATNKKTSMKKLITDIINFYMEENNEIKKR